MIVSIQLVVQGQRASTMDTKSTETSVTMETDNANDKASEPVSKRHKWRLKWKTRRLKRRADSESMVSERENGNTKGKRMKAETGLAKPVSGGRKRKNKETKPTSRNDAYSPSDKRVKNRSDERVKQGKTSDREMNKKQKLNITSLKDPGKVKGRRRRGGAVAQVEEAKFEKMVSKYRQRLEKFSDSRWLN